MGERSDDAQLAVGHIERAASPKGGALSGKGQAARWLIRWLALVGVAQASGGYDGSPLALLEAAQAVDRIVFVSSTTFTGAFGGVPAADLTCTDLAAAAGLVGTYRAWLSDAAGRSPSVTFTPSDVPFVMTTGVRVADGWADLTDGTINNPIVVDEQGNQPDTVPVVWTGTEPSGRPASSGSTCGGWDAASGGVSGQVGVFDAIGTGWSASRPVACDQSARLYCFQQQDVREGEAPAPRPTPGRERRRRRIRQNED